MKSEEIASFELRRVVEVFRREGLPSLQHEEELAGEHVRAFRVFEAAHLSFNEVLTTYGLSGYGEDQYLNAQKAFREALIQAVCAGLIVLKLVRSLAIAQGAIPQPDSNWRLYWQSPGVLACWNCGSILWSSASEGRQEQVEYCPVCGPVTET